ncbi:MAG: hypothetical protein AAFR87_22395 [Bacteroidota bacterium]
MSPKASKYLILILRITCTAQILGSAYKHFIQGANPVLMPVFVLGLLFVWMKGNKLSFWGLLGMSGFFLLQAIMKFIGSGYQIAQLVELTLQVCSPALLALALISEEKERLYAYFRLAIALTFLGHGWYALGFIYGQPPHFHEMVVNSLGFLGMKAEWTAEFLIAAGIMDMLVVIAIFVPKYVKVGALYAAIWGFLTSAARIASYVRFGPDFWLQLSQYLPEFLIRTPHYSIPWLVFDEAEIEEEQEAETLKV